MMNTHFGPSSPRPVIAVFSCGFMFKHQAQAFVLQGAIDAAHELGFNLVIYSGAELASADANLHQNVLYKLANSQNMNALVLLTSSLMSFVTTAEMTEFHSQYGVPKVSLGIKLPLVHSALVNNYSGMCAAVEHVLDVHGLKRIAFVCGPQAHEEAAIRFRAYRDTLEKHHIRFDPKLVIAGSFVTKDGAEAIRILIDERKLAFDALVAANDNMAIGAIDELQRRNIAVPQQVAVVGFDDIADAKSTVPALTTARQPLYDLGKQGVKGAAALLRGETLLEDSVLDTELVLRQSCGCSQARDVSPQNGVTDWQTEAHEQQQFRVRARLLNATMQALFAINDIRDLGDVMAEALPGFGIKSCFIAMYEPQTLEWSRLIFGYDAYRKDIADIDSQPRMLSAEIIDHVISLLNRQCTLLVQALQFSNTLLGFVIFDVEDAQAQTQLYEILAEQLGTVFHSRQIIKQLEEKHNLLRTLIDNLPDYVFVKDLEGRFLLSNTAHAIAAQAESSEALVGKKASDFFPEAMASQYEADDEYVTKLGQALVNQQRRSLDKMGTPKWVLTTKVPLRDAENNIVGSIGISRDISELKYAEEALASARDQALEASRAKSAFLATMSHEIRTPMNGVIGMAELVLSTPLTDEQRSMVGIIQSSANNLLAILNDILDFSKIEAGRLTLEDTEFHVVKMAESAADIFTPKAIEKHLTLMVFVDPTLPYLLRGDELRLRQILINLVGNAVKFTDVGEVVIRVVLEEKTATHVRVRFSVKDTGIGISASARRQLFQPFTQADSSTTRRYGGTGLGLAICARLVELMQGEIGVESQEGFGSYFWFSIPLELSQVSSFGLLPADFNGLRVLVVDDNASSREIIISYLSRWNCIAENASSGPIALRELMRAADAGQPYDAAILDLVMPEMDGLTLAKEIKQNSQLAATKLMSLTAFQEGEYERSDHEANFTCCLTKPIKQPQLLSALQGLSKAITPLETKPATILNTPSISEHRLLLVEDNAINQKVALMQLRKLGFQVEAASCGEEALDIVSKGNYSLILMDCQMPGIDGFEATRRIRQLETNSAQHIPIIAMTANAMQGDREACLAAGMDDYISKPINLSQIQTVLQKWLACATDF